MSKIISLVIAFGYLITAYVLFKDKYLVFLLIPTFLLFPLYLIWFGQGGERYISFMRITDETTYDMTKLAGWPLLLMPIIAYVISFLTRV